MERFKVTPEVCFVWIKDGKVLLLRRANTGWQDGKYCFPAGHGEAGESMAQGCAREAFEEVGVKIDPKHLDFLHTQYRSTPGDGPGFARVGFYFAPKIELPEPQNMEPEKCDDMQFFPLDNLPEMVAPFRAALDAIQRGEKYSEYGWEAEK
ncbi:MAG TPA: NUDIX domain-containing protein [Candidatus Paceibacterota bacterium]|nr:NUDIX domain-containing protein [Candidatus Paceibacterota bacterium]